MTGTSKHSDEKKGVLSDKERFGQDESTQKLKQMGEKTREAQSGSEHQEHTKGAPQKPKG